MDNPDRLIGFINCLPTAVLHLSRKIAMTSVITNGSDVRLPWVDNFFILQWIRKAFDLDDLNRLIGFVFTSSQSIYQGNLSQVNSIAFHNTQIVHDFVRAF